MVASWHACPGQPDSRGIAPGWPQRALPPAQLSGQRLGKEHGGAKGTWGGESVGTPRKGGLIAVRRYRRDSGAAGGIEDVGRVTRCFGMGRRPILLGGANVMETEHAFVLITSMFVF